MITTAMLEDLIGLKLLMLLEMSEVMEENMTEVVLMIDRFHTSEIGPRLAHHLRLNVSEKTESLLQGHGPRHHQNR